MAEKETNNNLLGPILLGLRSAHDQQTVSNLAQSSSNNESMNLWMRSSAEDVESKCIMEDIGRNFQLLANPQCHQHRAKKQLSETKIHLSTLALLFIFSYV